MTDNLFDQTDIFKHFPEHEQKILIDEAINRNISKGEYLTHQGDTWPYVVFLKSGLLRWVMLSSSGKEHVLFDINQGQEFWAHSIFDGNEMPASLVAAKKSSVLLWDQKTILRYLHRYPDVMWKITGKLTGIMRHAREIIYGLAFQPVAGRLASLLLQQCTNTSGNTIERNFTLNDLASTIASSPEAVCRLLYQFQDDGILKVTRASINIQDLDALKNANKD